MVFGIHVVKQRNGTDESSSRLGSCGQSIFNIKQYLAFQPGVDPCAAGCCFMNTTTASLGGKSTSVQCVLAYGALSEDYTVLNAKCCEQVSQEWNWILLLCMHFRQVPELDQEGNFDAICWPSAIQGKPPLRNGYVLHVPPQVSRMFVRVF